MCPTFEHQYLSYDPYLWWGFKCYQKGTLRTCEGVLRSYKVSLGLGRGLEEKYGLISKDWSSNRAEMGLGRRGQEGEEWR